MKCRICKTIKGNEKIVHLASTHGLSFLRQGVEQTPELKELWEKHKATGKEGSFKNKFNETV